MGEPHHASDRNFIARERMNLGTRSFSCPALSGMMDFTYRNLKLSALEINFGIRRYN